MTDPDNSLAPMDWLPNLSIEMLAASIESNFIFNIDQCSSVASSDDKTDSDCGSGLSHPEGKPPYSYASLITLAIQSSSERRMTLSEIYQWICDNFPYFGEAGGGWKNSVRHNLSLNKSFMKIPRSRGDPGKGAYWCLSNSQDGCEIYDPVTKKLGVAGSRDSTRQAISIDSPTAEKTLSGFTPAYHLYPSGQALHVNDRQEKEEPVGVAAASSGLREKKRRMQHTMPAATYTVQVPEKVAKSHSPMEQNKVPITTAYPVVLLQPEGNRYTCPDHFILPSGFRSNSLVPSSAAHQKSVIGQPQSINSESIDRQSSVGFSMNSTSTDRPFRPEPTTLLASDYGTTPPFLLPLSMPSPLPSVSSEALAHNNDNSSISSFTLLTTPRPASVVYPTVDQPPGNTETDCSFDDHLMSSTSSSMSDFYLSATEGGVHKPDLQSSSLSSLNSSSSLNISLRNLYHSLFQSFGSSASDSSSSDARTTHNTGNAREQTTGHFDASAKLLLGGEGGPPTWNSSSELTDVLQRSLQLACQFDWSTVNLEDYADLTYKIRTASAEPSSTLTLTQLMDLNASLELAFNRLACEAKNNRSSSASIPMGQRLSTGSLDLCPTDSLQSYRDDINARAQESAVESGLAVRTPDVDTIFPLSTCPSGNASYSDRSQCPELNSFLPEVDRGCSKDSAACDNDESGEHQSFMMTLGNDALFSESLHFEAGYKQPTGMAMNETMLWALAEPERYAEGNTAAMGNGQLQKLDFQAVQPAVHENAGLPNANELSHFFTDSTDGKLMASDLQLATRLPDDSLSQYNPGVSRALTANTNCNSNVTANQRCLSSSYFAPVQMEAFQNPLLANQTKSHCSPNLSTSPSSVFINSITSVDDTRGLQSRSSRSQFLQLPSSVAQCQSAMENGEISHYRLNAPSARSVIDCRQDQLLLLRNPATNGVAIRSAEVSHQRYLILNTPVNSISTASGDNFNWDSIV